MNNLNLNMCSGNVLEELVQKFCKEQNKDEGLVWQRINSIYEARFDNRNLMQEKNNYEREHNTGDIPMAQWIANLVEVHNITPILDELINVMI